MARLVYEHGSPTALAHRVVFEQALCHASLLVERLLFYNRNLGLLPRTSTASDPLGPIVVSDEDVATIFAGFRRIRQTEPSLRPALVSDPLGTELAQSRAALTAALAAPEARGLGFVEIVRAFDLVDSALDPFLLAIAPEWDARMGRLYGFLNNDTTRQRPTFGHLELSLQSGLPTVQVNTRQTLERSLLGPGLIELDTAAGAPQPSQVVHVPPHIVALSRTVIGSGAAAPDVLAWERLFWAEDEKNGFATTLDREIAPRSHQRRMVILEGNPGSGRSAAVRARAHALGVETMSCAPSPDAPARLETELAATLFRAKVSSSLLIVRSDGIFGSKTELWRKLFQLSSQLEVCCVVLVRPDESLPMDSTVRFIRLTSPRMRPVDRRRLWESALSAAGLAIDHHGLDYISTRFDITPGRVHELVGELVLRREDRTTVTVHDVSQALREITVQKLKDQATLYIADQTLDQLVLEPTAHERLKELVERMDHRYEVMDGWHFGGRSMRGYGVSALFAGPPGTGKTAAAGAVAHALDIDLYVIDLSRVMSKWIGETEQNLARVFDEAEASSVALLFDEADSLFGKRTSEVKSASDRYANITVNYLLQRMDRYSGLAILTTNLESAIDTAFSRRISTRIFFASPDADHRRKLWHQLLPPGVLFAPDVDLSELIRTLELPGARIRSALVRAAFRAAALGREQRLLTQDDIYWAAFLEYEDMGRVAPSVKAPLENDATD